MNTKNIAPVVLRVGLAFVFLWFGTNQILNQAMWVSLIPAWAVSLSGMSAQTFVIVNGIFEIVMAVFLAFGIYIRLVSVLLFLHLGMIVADLGLTAVGVRDIGLLFGLLSVALHGADAYSSDSDEAPVQTV